MSNIPILFEVEAAAQDLQEADFQRCERSLRPVADGERLIGEIHSDDLRRLWVLAFAWSGKQADYMCRAVFDSSSEQESQDFKEEASRYEEMSDLVREIFWTQARAEFGGKTWSERGLGIRTGFQLVAEIKEHGPPDIIRHILRGGMSED